MKKKSESKAHSGKVRSDVSEILAWPMNDLACATDPRAGVQAFRETLPEAEARARRDIRNAQWRSALGGTPGREYRSPLWATLGWLQILCRLGRRTEPHEMAACLTSLESELGLLVSELLAVDSIPISAGKRSLDMKARRKSSTSKLGGKVR